jgi:hypothetical protein
MDDYPLLKYDGNNPNIDDEFLFPESSHKCSLPIKSTIWKKIAWIILIIIMSAVFIVFIMYIIIKQLYVY